MPEIDRLAGLIFYLYFYDDGRHHQPHVHVCYGDDELIIAIDTGVEIEGYLPNSKRKMAIKHINTHRQHLLEMWKLAVKGRHPGKL